MTLIESIYKDPGSWTPGEHRFTHKNGASLWIANGLFFCQPVGGGFTLWNKWRAWRAYRWWKANAPVEAHGYKST